MVGTVVFMVVVMCGAVRELFLWIRSNWRMAKRGVKVGFGD